MARWYPLVVMALLLLLPDGIAEGQRRTTGGAQRRTAASSPAPRGSSRTDREARNLFEAGQHAFDSGNYERALDYFERAYALTQRSGFLYNIATTSDRMRADARALEAYRAFLAAEPDTERRAEVEARIAFIEGLLRPPPPPPPEPEPVPAPVEVVAPPEPVTPPIATPEPQPAGGVHPAGVVTMVGAGLLFASFGVFGGLSFAEDQALAGRCGRNAGATCEPSEVRDLELFNTVADVSWIAGSVTAAIGLVLLLALPPEREASGEAQLALAPWMGADGAGVVGVGRW
jgi:hypothetical protein